MEDITELLISTRRNEASDLHLSAGKPPMMRIHGEMVVFESQAILSPEVVKSAIYSVMSQNQRATYEKDLEIDFAISLSDDVRFRVNAFNTFDGPAAVFRLIPGEILTLDDIKAPPLLKELTKREKGLILITGPTGSGKSTTLAAMVDEINRNSSKHIITIEDPIEFVHKSKRSLVNQREVGMHTKSFASALKSALREDPDVILVGELRDLETVHLALTAAETGHVVMGTLHTSSAAKTIDRIIDVFPANEKEMIRSMLSSSIEAVITQKLLKSKDGKGRVAAHEIMIGNDPIRNLIRENKIPQMNSMIQIGSKVGMKLMKDAIYDLYSFGLISEETARAAISVKDEALPDQKIQGDF